MSENAKLRALLAEARREHDGDANIGACGADNDGNDTRCDRCQRIDAALAEPVVKELDVAELEDAALDAEDGRRRAEVSLAEALSSARSWEVHTHAANLRAERAEKERNEARAEVGKLREAVNAWAKTAEWNYRRGAEAMREAAASCVGSDTALLQTYRSVLEGRIRDLPVPEDKP